MTEEEKVQQIIDKYNQSIAELSEKATAKEFKFVMSYIAQEANRRQRELVESMKLEILVSCFFECTKNVHSCEVFL